MNNRTLQKSSANSPGGDGVGGSRRLSARLFTTAVTAPPIALLAAAGVWTFSPESAFDIGPAAFARRLEARKAAVTAAVSHESQKTVELQNTLGSLSWTSPGFSGKADGPSPLVLAGVSGEAMPPPVKEAIVTFGAPSAASAKLVVSGPVSVGDQTTMTPMTPPDKPAPDLKVAQSPAPAGGQAAADPHIPVADYALLFARQPVSAAANLEQASLRAGWRAVVETLILTGKPKPAAVHNM
jgi:hypothetical protein